MKFVPWLLGGEFDGEAQEAPPGFRSASNDRTFMSQNQTLVSRAAPVERSLNGKEESVYYRLRAFWIDGVGDVCQYVWDGLRTKHFRHQPS